LLIGILLENNSYLNSQISHRRKRKQNARTNELIEKGANINLCDEPSPIYIASQEGIKIEIIKILIENGANINLCDRDGYSPIYNASQNGNIEIIKILIENGANINLCDDNGNSPLYNGNII